MTKDAEAKQPVASSLVSRSSSGAGYGAFFATIQKSVPAEVSNRIVFETVRNSKDPISDALSKAQQELAQNPKNGGDIVVLGRHVEHFRKGSPIIQECLGAAADAIAQSGIKASLLVVQARGSVE